MPSTSTTVHPSGRGELLLWINSVCSAEYPSVESLRDGVAYCTIIDAAASRVAENCAALGIPEAHAAQVRAKRATQLLGRIEWDVTLATCTNQDPSLDSMRERDQCEKNMQTLQLMLRVCVPPEFSLELDASRLATGKLQEHILLLRWMFQFMAKMLNTYSKKALERRANSSGEVGCVEGVRMTRAMKLQRKMVRQKYIEPDDLGVARDQVKDSEKKSNTVPNWKGLENNRTCNAEQATQLASSPRVQDMPGIVLKESIETPPDSQVTHSKVTGKRQKLTPVQVSKSDGRSVGSHIPFSENTRQSSFTVPHDHYALLDDLRQDVETYEALALAAHRRHQRCLTASQNADCDPPADERCLAEEFLPSKAPIISLEQLGVLLEERDKLWQTLEVLQDALLRCRSGVGEGSGVVTAASPLMTRILSVLSPS
ncbi:hypothetical protein DQ04_05841030 [Trypanosoma grayi]|uniref:hypothetical protein n=1 Tax=Trypanosoma grayi TaxID=71804 RepID=UPI0004F449A8|nr:hypothetical protein DQ04_05841030 [Trypanosoma grayi]KEG09092.1 hypothetical protein DQ04_05841030 [Trypanosoma grayi]